MTEDDLGDVDLGAPTLAAAIEALLLLTDEPMSVVALAEVIKCPVSEVDQMVRDLARQYTEQGRGFDLREVAGGWRFYTRAECAPSLSGGCLMVSRLG